MIITEPVYIEAIEDSLAKDPATPYVRNLLNNEFQGLDVYLWGAALRNPLIELIHGDKRTTEDVDLAVNDLYRRMDLERLAMDLEEREGIVSSTGLGAPCWSPTEDVEIDVAPFTKIFLDANARPQSRDHVREFLQYENVTVNMALYDLRRRELHDHGALDAIFEKTIDGNYFSPPNTMWGHNELRMACRVVRKSIALNFDLGPRIIEYFQKNSGSYHLAKEHLRTKKDGTIAFARIKEIMDLP